MMVAFIEQINNLSIVIITYMAHSTFWSQIIDIQKKFLQDFQFAIKIVCQSELRENSIDGEQASF